MADVTTESRDRIKVFDIRLSEADARGSRAIDDVICKLRPNWSPTDIICEDIKKGYVNVMLRFNLKSDAELSDAVVMRLYGTTYGDHVFLRENELLLMQLSHQAGSFPAILGIFQNGVLYQYVHGRVLQPLDLHSPKVIRTVARTLAQLKCQDIGTTPLVDRSGNRVFYPPHLEVYDQLRRLVSHVPTTGSTPDLNHRYQQVKMSDAELLKEIDDVAEMLEAIRLPHAVAHNDLHIFNILHDDRRDAAYLLDNEFSYLGYEASDLAGLLEAPLRRVWTTVGAYFYDDREPEVNDDFRRQWVHAYVERRHELRGQPPPTDGDIKRAMMEHRISLSVFYLRHIILAHTFVEAELNGLPPLAIIRTAKECYFAMKYELPSLCEKYRLMVDGATTAETH